MRGADWGGELGGGKGLIREPCGEAQEWPLGAEGNVEVLGRQTMR